MAYQTILFKRTVKHYLFDQVRTSFEHNSRRNGVAIFIDRKISGNLTNGNFRTGKRVGYLIFEQVYRGDLANSAYHKTDSDPRLSRPGNYRETTIGRFRAMMGRSEGFARPARFAVRIELPTNLERILEQNVGFGEGQVDPGLASAARSSTTSAGIKSNNLAQLASQMGQQINIMCDSISMPAHDLQSEEHVTYGPPLSNSNRSWFYRNDRCFFLCR